jgi:subtilisin-like proprotein convertase family protein
MGASWKSSLLGICALALLAAMPAAATAKTKTFSSGDIDRAIPDVIGGGGVAIDSPVVIKKRGKVKDVNVAVRISHPDARDLDLIVENPAIKGFQLKEVGQLSEPPGADFGAGPPDCAGAVFTVFDSQATTPIFGATPPFAGSFLPAAPLGGFNGGQLRGKWRLELLDHNPGDAGVLNCWQLRVRYKPAKKRK